MIRCLRYRSPVIGTLAVAGWVLVLSHPVAANPYVPYAAVEQGQFRSNGLNFSGDDTMVTGSPIDRRAFATFDLNELPVGPIVSAVLRLQIRAYTDVVGSFNFSLWDYTGGDDSDLGLSISRVAAWTDLGDGSLYGQAGIGESSNPAGSHVDVTLSDAAIDDINNRPGELFTVGITSDISADPVRLSGAALTTLRPSYASPTREVTRSRMATSRTT